MNCCCFVSRLYEIAFLPSSQERKDHFSMNYYLNDNGFLCQCRFGSSENENRDIEIIVYTTRMLKKMLSIQYEGMVFERLNILCQVWTIWRKHRNQTSQFVSPSEKCSSVLSGRVDSPCGWKRWLLEINVLLSAYLSKQIWKWPQAYFMAAIPLINWGIEMCAVHEHRPCCVWAVVQWWFTKEKGKCKNDSAILWG